MHASVALLRMSTITLTSLLAGHPCDHAGNSVRGRSEFWPLVSVGCHCHRNWSTVFLCRKRHTTDVFNFLKMMPVHQILLRGHGEPRVTRVEEVRKRSNVTKKSNPESRWQTWAPCSLSRIDHGAETMRKHRVRKSRGASKNAILNLCDITLHTWRWHLGIVNLARGHPRVGLSAGIQWRCDAPHDFLPSTSNQVESQYSVRISLSIWHRLSYQISEKPGNGRNVGRWPTIPPLWSWSPVALSSIRYVCQYQYTGQRI